MLAARGAEAKNEVILQCFRMRRKILLSLEETTMNKYVDIVMVTA